MRKEMADEEKVTIGEGQGGYEELAEEESDLRRTIKVITSLITLSYSIKGFHVKWQLIRSKLEELNSGLTAAENCDNGKNTVFSELIPAILVTINDCYDLARRCLNLSFSGKLLMQSDLDIISSMIEVHLKSLAGLYNTGILTQDCALVVSRPSVGACKDDMKFYVRDLLTRLKIGGSEMKNQALVALNEVVHEDEKYVRIVVETNEIVGLLVNFLELGELEIQEEAVKAISLIAGFDSYKSLLVGAGVIAPLIRVLESGSDIGKERAARALQRLTENSDNAWSVSAHGGVTTLIQICVDGDYKESIGPACGALKNLAGVEEIKRFMVEEGAISAFVKLMKSKNESSQMNAIEFLQIMADGDEQIRLTVVREGGISSLVQVLDPKSSFSSSKLWEVTLRAIESFCFSSTSSLKALMGYGFLDRLLFILRNNEASSTQELALKISNRLCGISEEIKKAMGDAGFMPEVIRLLDARSFEAREMAAEVLSNMISVPRNRRRFVHEDCNISRVMQLLDPNEGKSGDKKFLLSILMSLTNCSSGRSKIATSCYLTNLERLAESDVVDAKKIVRKLSTNRIRNILNGIWKY